MDTVFAALFLVGGIAVCFSGYHLFKKLLRLWGAIVGGVALLLLLRFVLDPSLSNFTPELAGYLLIGFLAGAIAGGLLVMPLYLVVVFLSGAAGGALAGWYGYQVISGGQTSIAVGALGAVITGLLAMRLQAPLLILSTAVAGAYAMVQGGSLLLFRQDPGLYQLVMGSGMDTQELLPYLAAWGGLVILGIVVQFRMTAR
jgi:hypothetical protein